MIYDINGNVLINIYDINGNIISRDYNEYSNEYERNILLARDSWLKEAREDTTVIPMIVHTDQHGRLTANNSLFKYLSKAISWNEISACIGLGDAYNYNVTSFQNMETCLNGIPKSKQINIWGNHDTWGGSRKLNNTQNVASDEEFESVLCKYFDNSTFGVGKRYNKYGIEYRIDEENKIKYVVIGGWEYNYDLGGYSHYVIGKESMDYIIEMLSQVDEYDIVILSHIQPFKTQTASSWTYPPAEGGTQNGGGGIDVGVGCIVVSETSIDQMLIDRQNKANGTVKDSYGNVHTYDFTNCTSNILCCLAGHEHCDKYMYQNNNIPIYLFDAYAYDNHPIYFVNINRTKGNFNIWKIDDSPKVYNYQIPLIEIA